MWASVRCSCLVHGFTEQSAGPGRQGAPDFTCCRHGTPRWPHPRPGSVNLHARTPPPLTAHAKARCSASARTERRLLEGLPHEAPQVPRSDPQGPEPRPRAAPSSRPGASGGCEQNKFAHSLRGPAASHLVRSFRGRSPTQSGLRAPEPQQSREDCGARPEAGGRAASPAWGRTVAGLVRGGSSHVMREAGDAGSRGSAAGAGFWTTPAEQEPQGISCREGPREKRHEGGMDGASDAAKSSLWEDD